MAAIQESIMKQQQQELAIATEIQAYKKDIVKEQVIYGQYGRFCNRSVRCCVMAALHRWQIFRAP